VSRRLDRFPTLKDRLRKAYMGAEGTMLDKQFPSHQAGMVGVIKQIIDAAAVPGPADGSGESASRLIRSVHVNPAQVFVHKSVSG
jgi:hypothetical protein